MRASPRGVLSVVAGTVSVIAICLSSLTACSGLDSEGAEPVTLSTVAPPTPVSGGHLVYGLEADPNGLDPTRNAWDNSGIQLANALYDPLTAFGADGRPHPYLAESLTPDADYQQWTLKLRPGVQFSDGEPFDAGAVVTFMDALRASTITGPAAQMVTRALAVDPLTVQLSTSRPWASLPALLSGQGGYVVSPRQLADPDGTSRPIGTGPFILRSWQQDKRFVLVRNPTYWRLGLPRLDTVEFVVEADGARRTEMLTDGTIDVMSLSSPWDLKYLDSVLAGRPGALQTENDSGDAEKTSIMFNTTHAPVDDVRIRRAIAYATDIPGLAAKSGWPPSSLAEGPIGAASPFFSPAPYPTHDLAKAKALVSEYLADARRRKGPQTVTFTVLVSDHLTELMTQLVAQWAEAGIQVKLSVVDVKQLVRLAVLGNFDAMLFRYFAAPDPDLFWHFFVADTITTSGISLNFTRLRNSEITEGMNRGRSTTDVETRKQAYAKVQAAFADQLPNLWMQRWDWRVVSSRRVHDAHNVTLPDGASAMPLVAGTHRLTETWVDR
jgi:peptide/nickel transport system substrate-binding protein